MQEIMPTILYFGIIGLMTSVMITVITLKHKDISKNPKKIYLVGIVAGASGAFGLVLILLFFTLEHMFQIIGPDFWTFPSKLL